MSPGARRPEKQNGGAIEASCVVRGEMMRNLASYIGMRGEGEGVTSRRAWPGGGNVRGVATWRQYHADRGEMRRGNRTFRNRVWRCGAPRSNGRALSGRHRAIADVRKSIMACLHV